MGWANYYEDNIEIAHERMCARECSSCSTTPIEIMVKVAIKSIPTIEVPNHKHKKLVCQDCGTTFRFSKRDQAFFKQNGWADTIRCKECRDNRNAHFLMSA